MISVTHFDVYRFDKNLSSFVNWCLQSSTFDFVEINLNMIRIPQITEELQIHNIFKKEGLGRGVSHVSQHPPTTTTADQE